jgi:hypothetical protein
MGAKIKAGSSMSDGATKVTANGRRVVDEESELSALSDDGTEGDDEVPEDNSKEEEEEETEPANSRDAEESKDDEGNQSGKSSTVTSARTRKKKAGSFVPPPMWGWAYKEKGELKSKSSEHGKVACFLTPVCR